MYRRGTCDQSGKNLVDCALLYPFEHVLSMFDSALRRGLVTREEIVAVCDGLRVDCGPVFRLLHYADARSENGGESFCRAVSIEEGFVPPQLQHTFYSRVTGKEAGPSIHLAYGRWPHHRAGV